jgi:hypothetical protein
MLRRQILLIAAIAALGLGLNYNASAQSGQPAETSTSSVTTVTAHGKIVEVNKAKKLVTIEGTGGRRLYLKVENPYNLDAAKVEASAGVKNPATAFDCLIWHSAGFFPRCAEAPPARNGLIRHPIR